MKNLLCGRESPIQLTLALLLIFATTCMRIQTGSERPKFRDDYRYEKAFSAFYKLHTAASNWHQARIRCEAEGTELLVPDTLDEADAMPLLISSILTKFDGVYVGVHDLYSERYFVTVKGRSIQDSLLDLLWELEQPQHSGGRCVAMRRSGHLFVNHCSQPLPFICKVKLEHVSFYQECDSFDPHWKLGPNNTCYITHEERQTWHDAYSTCHSAGGHLAILDSREEAEYMRDMFKLVDQRKTPGDFAFLGFSDLFQRYHYRTILGNRMTEKGVDWDFQCSESSRTGDFRCGGFRRSGLLATADCERPSIFFCEKPAKGSFKLKTILRYKPENKVIRKLRIY